MTGLFAPGLALTEDRRRDGALLLRNSIPLPAALPDILDRFDGHAAATPDRVLLTEPLPGGDRAALAYGDARRQATALAAYLAADIGLPRGAMVATLVPAGIEAMLLKLACLIAGLVHVALPPFPFRAGTADPAARTLLNLARPGILFTGAAHPAATHPLARPLGSTLAQATAALDAAMSAVPRGDPDEIAALFFTSGSTGDPKGVPVTRGMISACQAGIAAMWPFLAAAPPVLADWLPWHHVFGGLDNAFKTIWHGGTLHLDHPPAEGRADASLRLMAQVRPTLHIGVPLGLKLLLDAIERDPERGAAATSRLRAIFFAGAGIDARLWGRLCDLRTHHSGIEILSGYGATEAGSTICLSPAPLERPGELGIPLPGHDLALVEADGRHEICLSGPTVGPHYLTSEGPRPLPRDGEGFYRTGDAATLHRRADGNRVLLFDGRIAEDFKLSNGIKVRTGPLRAGLLAACAPLLGDIVISGENAERLVAVVFPAAGLGGQAANRIGRALADWNRGNPGRSTAIARFALAPAAPDSASGELSDKGQIVRHRYLRNHAAVFADLHAGGGHAPT